MTKKQLPDAAKYFVSPVRQQSEKSLASERSEKSLAQTRTGETKYMVRTFPLPAELPEAWDGTGPDLPPGYQGAEACPDCSAFKFSRHAPLCIRNPAQQTFSLQYAWAELHTKEQIFFGVGHPILLDVDDYMTKAKQERLVRLNVVVLYDFPAPGSSVAKTYRKTPTQNGGVAERSVVAHWRERGEHGAR